MPMIEEKKPDEPIESRIRRVAKKVGRMSVQERFRIMIAAGLTTEEAVKKATARLALVKKAVRKRPEKSD
jgi:hypothetical protein